MMGDKGEPPICELPECTNIVTYSKWTHKWNRFCSRKCANRHNALSSIEKRNATCIERYGVTHPQVLTEIKNKTKASNELKYGAHPSALASTQSKIRETTQNRYGVDNASQSQYVKDKKLNTSLIKFGKHYSQIHLVDESVSKMHDIEWIIEQNKIKPLSRIATDIGCSKSVLFKIMNNAGEDYKRFTGYSTYEEELVEFLDKLPNLKYTRHDRVVLGGKELDVVIHSHKLAIELNGIYWHTENKGKDRKYHLNKTNICADAGIRLIQITDDEWINKRHIVESRISVMTGNAISIFGRKTEIRKLSQIEEKYFFDSAHLQGYAPSTISYGLFYNNVCVSAIKSFLSKLNLTAIKNSLTYRF